jgi:hypothetical protein
MRRPLHILLILSLLLTLVPLIAPTVSAELYIESFVADKNIVHMGDTLTLSVMARNTDPFNQSQTIYIYKDHQVYQVLPMVFPAGSTNGTNITWKTDQLDQGSHEFMALLMDSERHLNVTVSGPVVEISDLEAHGTTVSYGHTINLTCTMTNKEDFTLLSATISVMGDGNYLYSVHHNLPSDTPYEVELGLSTDRFMLGPGVHTISIVIYDQEESIEVTVLDYTDVHVTSLKVPEQAQAGQTIVILMHLENRGSSDAYNVTLHLYLCDDIYLAEDEILTETVPVVRVGESEDILIPWTIPDDQEPGEYWITAQVDQKGIAFPMDDIYISNPLGGTPVYYYVFAFILAGVVMGALLVYFITRGSHKMSKDGRKAPPKEDDDIEVLED